MARFFDASIWSTTPQYLEVQSTPVTGAPITLAGWANRSTTNTGFAETVVIGLFASAGARNQMCIEWTGAGAPSDGIRARCYNGSALGDANMASSLATGTWHHCAGVFASDSSRTPYLDGIAGTANTTTVVQTGIDRISVGRSGDSSPDSYFWGRLAEVAIWNVALTAAEIAYLAAGGLPTNVRPASLVFYNDTLGSASPEPDLSGGGRPLTVFNVPPPTADHPPMRYPYPVFRDPRSSPRIKSPFFLGPHALRYPGLAIPAAAATAESWGPVPA